MHPAFVSLRQKLPFALRWQPFLRKARPSLEQRRHAAPPVLVYQFGKVGSSSLHDSLAPQWPGVVVHTHSLKERDGESAEMAIARDTLRQRSERVFIITTVREPIGRNISAFFQNFERETGVPENRNQTISIQRLIELFLASFPHDMPLTWFDQHFKDTTGIDIFQYEFPRLGIQIIREGKIDLLLMLSEIPDWLKEIAVKRLLGLDEFRIHSANVSNEKPYAATYRAFLQSFIAPEWYLRKMYGSRFFQHFYAAHNDALAALWTRQFTVQHRPNSELATTHYGR